MQKVIPEKRIRICDRCKSESGHVMSGGLKVIRGATDWQGCVVACGDSYWDLCDNCVMEAETLANDFMKRSKTCRK